MRQEPKLVGHHLGQCLDDLANGHVAVSSVVHIESIAIIPTAEQLRNFVDILPLGDRKHHAYDIALSLWESGRLVHDKRADKNCDKLGRWRTAKPSEIGRNQPHEGAMISFASRARTPKAAANDADAAAIAA
ncbi:hypothetical protein [Erythrobacter aureus]|uniref:Uncharacterized protein n=1 Tax=Erythrobacter aureus TaxID=2182384 RepID=A0A345YJ20_9SPHN|nr:hypothetical protein [Erythrobacter aureus]AXK43922.1 hypothetical protein DVR09_15825 [Erythrobacter aureus]